mmetsp:Transcript_97644/g.276240  ORF Transcript_97644/g.276240 Transcript_97644/m.276240 type:complete len:91 (+) Transcript_97644:138-410(+)
MPALSPCACTCNAATHSSQVGAHAQHAWAVDGRLGDLVCLPCISPVASPASASLTSGMDRTVEAAGVLADSLSLVSFSTITDAPCVAFLA